MRDLPWLFVLLALVPVGENRARAAPPEEPARTEAEASAEGAMPEVIAGHDACPTVFGDAETRSANRAQRRALLKLVDQSPYAIVIAHTGTLEEPRPAVIPDLEVLETHADGPMRKRTATVGLGHAFASLGCPEGRYKVRVDDSIGVGLRVVAILDALLLVGADFGLVYLGEADLPPPKFSMAWVSSWPANPYLHRPATRLKTAPRRR